MQKRNVNIVGKNLTAQKMTADIAVTNAERRVSLK